MRKTVTAMAALALAAIGSNGAFADDWTQGPVAACSLPGQLLAHIQSKLSQVVNLPDHNGGLFNHSNQMWSAVVDRFGILCSVIKVGDAWPGSRDIAIAKASTANDFSNQLFALSTANLYAATQPGGSLYGLNNSNPFDPRFNRQGTGTGYALGGIITFGGGVPLYQNDQVIGGLGVSGDSSCADHAIAFRMRRLAGLDGPRPGRTAVAPGPTTSFMRQAAWRSMARRKPPDSGSRTALRTIFRQPRSRTRRSCVVHRSSQCVEADQGGGARPGAEAARFSGAT